MTKGKRKLQTRKGSKLLQLQAKADSDSESDTGINRTLYFEKSFALAQFHIFILYLS